MASSLEFFSLVFFDTLSWPFLPKPHHCLQSGSGHFPPLLQQLPNWSSLGWPLFHPVPHDVATVTSFPDSSHEPLFSLVLHDLVVVSIATPTHLHSIWTFLPFYHLPSSSGRSPPCHITCLPCKMLKLRTSPLLPITHHPTLSNNIPSFVMGIICDHP